MTYTPAQFAAIHYRGSLLLSAAAGSGKTASLTARITELISSGEASSAELLVVTFTKAAAGEMRERISSSIRKLIAQKGGSARLSRELALLESADISTIHSFLLKSLRPYLPTLGLSADSRIADERTVKKLKSEIMADVVDDFFASAREDFLSLADIIADVRETSAIDSELLWIADRLEAAGYGCTFLAECAEELSSGDISRYTGTVVSSVGECVSRYSAVFEPLCEELCEQTVPWEKYGATADYIRMWIRKADELCKTGDYSALREHFSAYNPPDLGRLSAKYATETTADFKFFRGKLEDDVARVNLSLLSSDIGEAQEGARRTGEIVKTVERVVSEYRTRFERKKRESSLLDYNDLEALAHTLFVGKDGCPTEAAREIGAKYKYIFIDEYQDTNRVQDEIFTAVASGTVRFLVGDIKQSIYRFRGADPSVFADYRRKWRTVTPEELTEVLTEELTETAVIGENGSVGVKTEAESERTEAEEVCRESGGKILSESEQNGGVSLFMSENFRCSEPIVDFVNTVSGYTLIHGGVPYSAGDDLIFARGGGVMENSASVEVCIVEKKKAKRGTASRFAEPTADREAEFVAEKISSLIGTYYPSGDRIISAGDIAILLRAPSSSAADYIDALARRGISAESSKESSLGSFASVKLVVCLLNFIDNPMRDIFTSGALYSPLFRFTLDDIITLRSLSGELPIYSALSHLAREASEDETLLYGELIEKCKLAEAWQRKQRLVAEGMERGKLIEYIYREADIFSLPGIRGNGAERDALYAFSSSARDFERMSQSSSSLAAFVEFTEGILKEKYESAGTKENAVQILSIHSSKGLEYPICFVSAASKARNVKDETRTVVFDEKLGVGMFLPDDGRLSKCDTLVRRAIAENIRSASVEEEMRMLYVAMTRAREMLFVTAKTENADSLIEKCTRQVYYPSPSRVRMTDTYIEWILEAVLSTGGFDNGDEVRKHRRLVIEYDVQDATATDSTATDGTAIDGTAGVAEEEKEASPAESPDSHESPNSDESPDSCESPNSHESPNSCEFTEEDEIRLLENRFGYEYSYAHLGAIPSKLTVSRLYPEILDEGSRAEAESGVTAFGSLSGESGEAEEAGDKSVPESEYPEFMRGKQITGAERGVATHLFMQCADFRRLSEFGISAEVERLVGERFMSRREAELINRTQLERFVSSALMDKLLRSSDVRREFRFNVKMPAHRFTADGRLKEKLGEEKLTVQGVVDCLYLDPDISGYVLIDYKTDYLTAEELKNPALGESRLRSRHKNQLTYYREICEEMLGQPVKCEIYSTALGRCVEV